MTYDTKTKIYTFQDLILPLSSSIFLLLSLHIWRTAAPTTARKNLPPSPQKLSIIGNLHQLEKLPHRSLHSLSKQYGHLMLLHLGKVRVVVASTATAAQEILKNQDLIFSNRPKLKIPDKVNYGSRDIAFAPYDEYWRQVRSICVLHLLSNRRVQSFRRVREEETSIMVDKIQKLGLLSPVVNLSDVLVALTNDVVFRVALGRKYGGDGEGERFKEVLEEYVEVLGASLVDEYIPWLTWVICRLDSLDSKVERVVCFFDEFLRGVLEDHRDKGKREKLDDVL